MRRFFSLIAPLLLLGFVGCGGDQTETEEPKPVIPTIELISGAEGFTLPELDGGTAQLSFTTNAEWTLSCSDTRAVPTWFDVNPKSGPAGTHTVTITTVEPNELYDDRSGFVKIACGGVERSVMVIQKRKDAILLTQSKYELPKEGGTIAVEVKSNMDYTATIQQPEWIHQAGTRGLSATTYRFVVDASEEATTREGQILFQAGDLTETVHISQAGGEILVLSQKEYTVPAAGETIKVELRSNTDFELVLPEVDWIQSGTTRAVSSYQYHFTVAANESPDSRMATILFKTKSSTETVTITQLQRDAIVVAKEQYEVAPEGGMLDLELAANVEVKVAVADEAQAWIKQLTTRAMTQSTLHFEIAPNDTDADRQGTITFSGGSSSQTIVVSQAHLPTEEDALRSVLVQLYNSTNGDQWKNNSGWCTTASIATWYGVTMDHEKGTIALSLGSNNLTGVINLADCSAISSLRVAWNNLTAIDVSNCSALTDLDANRNPLTAITVTGCRALQGFSVGYDALSQIDLSGCSALLRFSAENSTAGSVTLPKSGTLTTVSCSGSTNLEQLDLSQQTALKTIECSNNSKLTYLYVDGCTSLETIECSRNPYLKGLDTRGCHALKTITCLYNRMESLIASGCQSLQLVQFFGKDAVLEWLDVSNCPSLTTIYWSGNTNADSAHLYAANLSGCTALPSFGYHLGGLKSLDVSGCVSMWSLDCGYNKDLINLNVSGCRSLRQLFCQDNQLSELDLTTCEALEDLNCSSNALTGLDVSSSPHLKQLLCFENQLSSLKLGTLPKLQFLWCANNELTDIALSGCPALVSLGCENNPITRVITDYYTNLQSFSYDKRYEYLGWSWEVPVWRYIYEDHHGWYYPDEPYEGYIYGGE